MAGTDTRAAYDRVPFPQHMKELRWDRGEHLMIAGPTSAGKTTLMSRLVKKRSHKVVFVTKMHDPTFASEFKGWTRKYEWKDIKPYETHILLWPQRQKTMAAMRSVQKEVFGQAFDAIGRQGNRCLIVDEMLYMTDPSFLGFGKEVAQLHYHGRSSGLSMVTCTQRPAWIPKVVMSSVTHGYIARTRDIGDMKRLSDLSGMDNKETGQRIMLLEDRHDYVYLNPQGDSLPVIVNTRK